MNQNQLISTTKQLIAIPSTGDNLDALNKAYEYVVQLLRSSGKEITIEKFESGNKPSLLAYRGPQRPKNFHIILNGHVDVVGGKSEQYKAFVKDDKLYGRGAYDMKAAVVVLTDIFCEFVDKVPYPLALQIVTDEESAGKHGTLHQVEQGVRADFVICGDCGRSTSTHEIANEAKGIAIAEIAFNGKSAHSAYPWHSDNAALKALQFVHKLHERYPAPSEATDQTTLTVTAISATSDAHTKIPDYATVRLDGRYTINDSDFADKAAFEALIKQFDPDAQIITVHDFSSPIYTPSANPLLQLLKKSAEKVEGAEFSFVRRNGTSDGRHYGSVGDQACEFGLAGEHQHGDDEYIPLEALRNYHATMHDFLQETLAAN